jgi:hypothetical protein
VVVVFVVTPFSLTSLLCIHPTPHHRRAPSGPPHTHARVWIALPARHAELAFGRLDQHGLWKVTAVSQPSSCCIFFKYAVRVAS